jgi:hypothetical protein
MSEVCTRWYISVTHKYVRSKCWFLQVLVSYSLGFWGRTILWFTLKPSSSFVRNVLALFCFGPRWTPHDEFYSLERCAIFRPRQFSNVLFGALVDASGQAELYGTTDQSLDPDRLVCTSQISILEASTPNLLIVQNPLVSLLRTPIGYVWEADVDSFKFLQAAR